MDDLLDGGLHEWRRIEGNRVVHARRQAVTQAGHSCSHRLGGTDRIGTGRQLYRRRRGRLAILPVGESIGLGAQFHPRHVAEHHAGTVHIGAQHDGGELLRRAQLSPGRQHRGHLLAGDGRRRAHAAGNDLCVLLGDGGGEVVDGQIVGDQLVRIDPDPHGLLGAEQLHAADPIDAPQLLHDIARHVIVQRQFIKTPVIGIQADDHQEAGRGGLDAQAVLAHRLR